MNDKTIDLLLTDIRLLMFATSAKHFWKNAVEFVGHSGQCREETIIFFAVENGWAQGDCDKLTCGSRNYA